MPHIVFVVDAGRETLAWTAEILSGAGYLVATASTFEEAKRRLALSEPDLLIADVRLGAYNGLHLILRTRAQHPSVAAILTDAPRDPVFEAEARRVGAAYLTKPVNPSELCRMSAALLAGRMPRVATAIARRWPRKQPIEGVVAVIGGAEARLTDLSYGGLRVESPGAPRDPLPGSVEVTLPPVGLSVRTRPVWTRSLAHSGPWWCGAELAESDPQAMAAWRDFVDLWN